MCHSQKKLRHSTFILLAIIWILPVLLAGCITIAPTRPSDPFLAQKGHLAWPSEGVIARSFGTEVNPVYGTRMHNPGIWISTAPSAAVRSVYAGEVEDVYTMPEFGRVVTISHGAYTSLYGNVSSLQVSPGMVVAAGQLIGRSGAEREAEVFFALFENGVELNPEPWLASR